MDKFDLIVIGSGVGLTVLDKALEMGWTCALVENLKFGGTCLTKGCIPSKSLTWPADLIREMQDAQRVGLDFALKSFDWDKIANRMWKSINETQDIELALDSAANLKVFKGTASFIAPHRLSIAPLDGSRKIEIQSERIIIAAGARTHIPDVAGLTRCGFVMAETFFNQQFPSQPYESLVIVGGGAIGCEFAHIFSAFGTRVTVIESTPRLLSREEPAVSQHVAKSFARVGIEVITGARLVKAVTVGDGKQVTVEVTATGQKRQINCQEIMIATGLQPNSDLLKVKKAGLATDDQGWIKVNEYMETNVSGIWAIGDIDGKLQFRHKGEKEAGVVVHNLFKPAPKQAMDYNKIPWAIYTYPQVAHVGLTEAQVAARAKIAGQHFYVGQKYYSSVAKGEAMGYESGSDEDGFVKVICDEHKHILGAHAVGANADLLIQGLTYLMNSDNNPIYDSIVIHPSLNEVANWVFYGLELRGGESGGHKHETN